MSNRGVDKSHFTNSKVDDPQQMKSHFLRAQLTPSSPWALGSLNPRKGWMAT
eukprot:c6892_g1_i1 orf=486-641(+)